LCILCENNNTEVFIKHDNFEIIRCNECGLYYQNTPKQFETLSNIYNNMYEERPQKVQNKFYWKKRMKTLYRDIKKYQKDEGSLLDIGCSYGFLMDNFIKKGWRATGIDVSRNAVNYAKSKGLNCFNSALLDSRFENKFDVIIMDNVLEHLEDPVEALSLVKNWLANKGIIYIRVPNIESKAFLFKRKSFIGDLKPFEHLFYFSKHTLKLLLNKVGLKSHVTTDGRVNIGTILNRYFRSKLVFRNSWQALNYRTKTEKKKKYLMAKSIYGEMLWFLGCVPIGPRNSEVVATASLNDLG